MKHHSAPLDPPENAASSQPDTERAGPLSIHVRPATLKVSAENESLPALCGEESSTAPSHDAELSAATDVLRSNTWLSFGKVLALQSEGRDGLVANKTHKKL